MPFNRPIPDSNRRSNNTSGFQSLVQAEKLMQIALALPSATFIGWLAGAWIGSRMHQSWVAIVGLILGIISGLVYVIRLAIDAEKTASRDDKSANGNGNGSSHSKQ